MCAQHVGGDAGNDVSFGEALSDSLNLTLFGVRIKNFDISAEEAEECGIDSRGARILHFIRVKAWRFGGLRCFHLPSPLLLLMSKDGQPLVHDECGFKPGEVSKWTVGLDQEALGLSPIRGPVGDLLEEFATRGVSGGISFENPHIQGGKLCVTAHIWAKIEVLGKKVHFDERIPVCIGIGEPCFTVWEIGWANLKICYKAPFQICAKLCVGKFGIEKCWDACVSIPHGSDMIPNSAMCECGCGNSDTE